MKQATLPKSARVTVGNGSTLSEAVTAAGLPAPVPVPPAELAPTPKPDTLTGWQVLRRAAGKQAPSTKPAAVFDGLASFASEFGLPFTTAGEHREAILTLSGMVTKAKWTTNGTRSQTATNLVKAAQMLRGDGTGKAAALEIRRAATLLAMANGESYEV